jgi:hypothetical protein
MEDFMGNLIDWLTLLTPVTAGLAFAMVLSWYRRAESTMTQRQHYRVGLAGLVAALLSLGDIYLMYRRSGTTFVHFIGDNGSVGGWILLGTLVLVVLLALSYIATTALRPVQIGFKRRGPGWRIPTAMVRAERRNRLRRLIGRASKAQ